MIATNIYYIISAVLVLGVLVGIGMMSKVNTARMGNLLSALCTVAAIAVVLYDNEILTAWQVWLGLAIGAVIGLIGAVKVKMIEMPQAVALLNGLGGLASALVAILAVEQAKDNFEIYVGAVALLVGWITFTGSLVAAGKLHKLLPQKPVVWKAHSLIVAVTLIALLVAVVLVPGDIWLITVISAFFGIAFAIRVGGADMPITISLLNSLSGVAGGIAGIAVGDPLLVAIGGVVGASGLLLTQIMCRAMNRSLISILLGSSAKPSKAKKEAVADIVAKEESVAEAKPEVTVESIMSTVKKVMIVPGYGMALAQAQSTVKALADKLESKGVDVKFAIHPVAGRMPGHMNVLLCEVDVPYDKLYEMDAINGEFAECDAAIIIGANDVVNPAANTAEGTPIYGMPVLNAADAKNVIICNFDDKPGYAGVPNPLYSADNAILMLGDAKDTVAKLISAMDGAAKEDASVPAESNDSIGAVMSNAKKVMIVPGYGMALAQAQSTVKALSDKLEAKGVEVKFAIHPVAGRMPGHMNVLLCEVDVPYDKLYEMDAVNGEFAECDAAIIIGANDVVNPAANTAEGTPIYGMPVLNAADAKNVIVCNFDDKPGYAGVPNPLYSADNAILMLGDAKDTVAKLISAIDSGAGDASSDADEKASGVSVADIMSDAKKVMIVPGYGMALAQAQSTVKALADKLESKGVEVKFAIHPVAGRMPGHMNVLLCEVDVPYDKLYEMDAVNGEFAECDAAIIIGANDVVNPAANTAEGTPIYGMPVLNAADAKNVIICNFDDKPGYAGVPNPLYSADNAILMLGDAKDTVSKIIESF